MLQHLGEDEVDVNTWLVGYKHKGGKGPFLCFMEEMRVELDIEG